MFETDFEKIIARLESVDPSDYGRTRNFLNGSVSRLSPYISRGVISTRDVYDSLVRRGFDPLKNIKFVQELAWRDYFQNIWRSRDIDSDLKRPQPDVENHLIAKSIVKGATGITAVDAAIQDLYSTGYVHNHARMYIASIACNIGKSHWKIPAKWFYYNLFDADWASNALSWQWVAGAFSFKKYFANQANINRFSETDQRGTFLDVDYEFLPPAQIPAVLNQTVSIELESKLPQSSKLKIDKELPTLIYNFYNLDPRWRANIRANRIFLIEPEHFKRYPVSEKVMNFALKLSGNIPGIQIFTGSFSELTAAAGQSVIFFKEHPTAVHYKGSKDERDWLFPEIKGYFPSFFAFWKQCENLIRGQRSLF